MRLVYIDEAGISAREPWIVVAGIVVQGDQQWKLLEWYVQELINQYIPQEKRKGFVFHAKELFHGGKTFNRENWPLDKRIEILEKLALIPAKFSIPIVVGYMQRAPLPTYRLPPKEALGFHHALVFTHCAIAVESCMRRIAKNEVAILVSEDNGQARRLIKKMQELLRSPVKAKASMHELLHPYLPLSHIVDTTHFAAKQDSILLQIADTCAFIIRRYLEKALHGEFLFRAMCTGHPESIEFKLGGCQVIYPDSNFLESPYSSERRSEK